MTKTNEFCMRSRPSLKNNHFAAIVLEWVKQKQVSLLSVRSEAEDNHAAWKEIQPAGVFVSSSEPQSTRYNRTPRYAQMNPFPSLLKGQCIDSASHCFPSLLGRVSRMRLKTYCGVRFCVTAVTHNMVIYSREKRRKNSIWKILWKNVHISLWGAATSTGFK